MIYLLPSINNTMFAVNERVQAVDVLGRWENGRITAIDAEKNVFTVHFLGWDHSFDTEVCYRDIRTPVSLLQDDVQGMPRKRKKRSLPGDKSITNAHTSASQLQRGMEVHFDEDGLAMAGRILLVDRFRGTATVEVENEESYTCTINIRDISICNTPNVKQRAKKRQKNCNPVCENMGPQMPTDQQEIVSGTQCPEVQTETTSGEGPSIYGTSAVSQKGVVIQCGLVYDIDSCDTELRVQVHSIIIRRNSTKFKGHLIMEGQVCQSMQLEAPLQVLARRNLMWKEDIQISRAAHKMLRTALMKATWEERALHRRCQLTQAVHREIQLALKAKSTQRVCVLGVLSPDTDLEIFPVELSPGKKIRYGYNKKFQDISLMDQLLPQKWDVLSSMDSCNFRYVTKVTLALSSDMILKLSVSSSICRQQINNDYRIQISQDICNSVNLNLQASDDEEAVLN